MSVAILIIGASGHAERSMESADTIAGIVAQCGKGLFDDFRQTHQSRGSGQGIEGFLEAASKIQPKLTIDGQSRAGMRAWAEAAWQVGGYVADCRDAGSVEYAYRLRVRGYDVRRSTTIQDGRVVLTTDAWWIETVPVTRRISRRVPIHVTITISASERSGPATVLVGTAIGRADTREFQCGIVRRIAERQAADTLNGSLRTALADIERGGRQFYAGGEEIADMLDRIKLGINIGQLLRR